MKNKNMLIVGGIGIVLVINFVIYPFLHHQEAKRIVTQALNYWQANDSASGVHLWKDEKTFPPIYSLKSYQIQKAVFSRSAGRSHAHFEIRLNFYDGNIVPSGKTWICEAEHTDSGWKILDFYLPGVTKSNFQE